MELTRLIVTQPDGTIVGDIDPTLIVDAGFVQEVNGEHSITLSTFEELSKNDRILWRDEMGVWHENVVEGCDGEHGEHGETLHEYWCPWSLQHDLAATFVTAMPGTGGTPAPALAALQAALGGTERWEVGTVTQTSSGSASMWRVSGWEAMQTLVEVWGGELSATIDVSLDGVVGRYVNLLAHVGATTPSRRFDYGGDLLGIRRIVADQPWTCRVLPLGKAQQTEGGGYGRKVTIESVNGGVPWLEDSSATPLVRVPTEDGWEYPTQIVENPELDDPAALKAWALDHLTDWTLPKVSYEVDVLQLAAAGTDATGVAEGDEVVVVDHGFTEDGLAIQGRALRIEGSLLDPAQTKLTISNLTDTLGGQLDSIARSVSTLADQQQATSLYQATADYLSELLGRLNAETNATGGYTYITEGEGIRTYDRAVSDPLVGAEATKVVEVKGGTIRIADSRTAQGAWDWRTVFVSGHILADLVTAAKLTAGHIGSAQSGNYWNLDSGEFRMASTAQLGTQTVQQVVDGVASASSAASSAQSTANSASSAAAAAQSTADSASSAAASAQSTADAASSAASSAQSAVNALSTQDAIFNLLTNNGQLQGLYMSGGELYVNGTYIKTGILASQDNSTYWNLNTGEMALVGNLTMVSDGFRTGAKTYLDIGSFTAKYKASSNDLITGTGRGIRIYSDDEYPDYACYIGGVENSYGSPSSPSSALRKMSVVTSEGALSITGAASGTATIANALFYALSNGGCIEITGGGTGQFSRLTLTSTSTTLGTTQGTTDNTVSIRYDGLVTAKSLKVTGTKNREVRTKSYGHRLLYAYETPAPYFGDIGSATIGEDGLCYVEIDAVFAETVRTDMAYQVFLQKCGEGDLWVAEKTPTHFVVKGTAGLPFDWEVKAHQVDYAEERLDNSETGDIVADELADFGITLESAYDTDLDYAAQIEALYEMEESDEAA